MNWSHKKGRRPWARYHHGNLKEALVAAARDLAAEFGPQGFSLAEAARRAGVSAAAPYRHFSDRQALMSEVARQGYLKLHGSLQEAWNDGMPDPASAFARMSAGYLRFAAEEPAAYAVMFQSGLGADETAALHEAATTAFAILVAAAARLGGRMPDGTPADPRQIAAHIWALAHGVATLLKTGGGQGLITPEEASRLLATGTATYLAGLQMRTPAPRHRPTAD